MLAGGCGGPFGRRAGSVVRAGKPDMGTAAGRVTGITDQPVAALTMPLRQIVTAHPRPDRRDAAPAHLPDPTDGPLCRCPVADALDRPALHHPVEHGDTARIDGDEHPQLPAYDLMEQPIGGQSLAHRIAEPRQLDPVHPPDARPAQPETSLPHKT